MAEIEYKASREHGSHRSQERTMPREGGRDEEAGDHDQGNCSRRTGKKE